MARSVNGLGLAKGPTALTGDMNKVLLAVLGNPDNRRHKMKELREYKRWVNESDADPVIYSIPEEWKDYTIDWDGHTPMFVKISRLYPLEGDRERVRGHAANLALELLRTHTIEALEVEETKQSSGPPYYGIDNGHHRWSALKKLKFKTVPVIIRFETESRIDELDCNFNSGQFGPLTNERPAPANIFRDEDDFESDNSGNSSPLSHQQDIDDKERMVEDTSVIGGTAGNADMMGSPFSTISYDNAYGYKTADEFDEEDPDGESSPLSHQQNLGESGSIEPTIKDLLRAKGFTLSQTDHRTGDWIFMGQNLLAFYYRADEDEWKIQYFNGGRFKTIRTLSNEQMVEYLANDHFIMDMLAYLGEDGIGGLANTNGQPAALSMMSPSEPNRFKKKIKKNTTGKTSPLSRLQKLSEDDGNPVTGLACVNGSAITGPMTMTGINDLTKFKTRKQIRKTKDTTGRKSPLGDLNEDTTDIQNLIEKFKNEHPEEIDYGAIRGNCGVVASAFVSFCQKYGKKVYRVFGEFVLDNPQTDIRAFNNYELTEIEDEGLDPYSEGDRLIYIEEHNLENDFAKVPHYWNLFQNKIIDLSGEAQFVDTGLASDLSADRYIPVNISEGITTKMGKYKPRIDPEKENDKLYQFYRKGYIKSGRKVPFDQHMDQFPHHKKMVMDRSQKLSEAPVRKHLYEPKKPNPSPNAPCIHCGHTARHMYHLGGVGEYKQQKKLREEEEFLEWVVEEGFPAQKPGTPPILYHGTSLNRVESINKNGLSPVFPVEEYRKDGKLQHLSHVWLTHSKEDAKHFAKQQAKLSNSSPYIVKIDTKKLPSRLKHTNMGFAHYGKIPPEAIIKE